MMMKRKQPKYWVGQVVYGWNGVRLFKIKSRRYRNKGDEFDGYWYEDEDEQEFFERELRPLTALETGPRPARRKSKGVGAK